MFQLKFGLTIFLSTIIPTTYLIKLLLGGMYGSIFRQFPPAVYITTTLIISLLVAFIFASVFINKTDLANRLPMPIPGQGFLLSGGILILTPQVLRIFTSMVEGGGASFTLVSLAAPFLLLAKVLLYIGVIKLLMAVKPHESYVYQ